MCFPASLVGATQQMYRVRCVAVVQHSTAMFCILILWNISFDKVDL